MSSLTPILQIFSTSAKKVTNSILRDFNELGYIQIHNTTSNFEYAIKTFNYIENKIYEDLKKFKPQYNYALGSGNLINNLDTSNTIVINSICGFDNFKRSIPYFSISIGLIRDKKEFAGVVYNPLTNELFAAEKDKGAFLNQNRLRNKNTCGSNNLISVSKPSDIDSNNTNDTYTITNCISLDLCYLASGRINFCACKNKTNYLEIMPSIIIVKEAGYPVSFETLENYNICNLIAGSNAFKNKINL